MNTELSLAQNALFDKSLIPEDLREFMEDGACGECYICHLIQVFREVNRVLRDDGVLWVNLGDSYATDTAGWRKESWSRGGSGVKKRSGAPGNLKPKDLMGIPWKAAFALQDDGWYLRSESIWSKRSPMPESVRDRPTRSHEHVFLFAKQPRYYWDWYAVLEPTSKSDASVKRRKHALTTSGRYGDERLGNRKGSVDTGNPEQRNLRSVWTLSSESFKGSHYAVMPSKLVVPCIKAGSSERGCCGRCRAPFKRIVEKQRVPTRPGRDTKVTSDDGLVVGNRDPERHVTTYKSVGWEPTCRCGTREEDAVPCIVLDCFGGAQTVPLVAENLGRWGIGVEAGRDYCRMGYDRINHPHLSVPRSARVDKPAPLFDGLEAS